MQPRKYQQEAEDAVFAHWAERGAENALVELPTAAGKTVVFSRIIKRLWQHHESRVIVLAHRKELIEQAEKKLRAVWPDAPVGVLSAGLGRRELRPITIASRDTLAGIVEHVGAFDVMIVDEAHNIPEADESRYQKIIKALGAVVLGFTATPYRTGKGLIYGPDKLFPSLTYRKSIAEMLDEGWLCPPTSKVVHGQIDTSEVATTAGDFNLGQLDKAARVETLVAQSLDEWQRMAGDRNATLFFAVSVAHAELIQSILRARGLDTPVITGETHAVERAAVFADFENGRISRLINVGVAAEGYDNPRLDCICLLRPTKSLGLYLQMVGRGFRLHETKTNCLILDFGGNIERFGPIDIATPPSPRKKDERTKACPMCLEIVSFFARKCKACAFQFEPTPHKLCESCGEENATSATVCVRCGAIFARHEAQAARGGILSKEPRPKTYYVESATMQTGTSSNTGLPYVAIYYWRSGAMNSLRKILCLGYPGWAGQKAAKEWKELALPGTPVPADTAEAMRLGVEALRPVRAVTVDAATKYKDIIRIHFADDTKLDLDKAKLRHVDAEVLRISFDDNNRRYLELLD